MHCTAALRDPPAIPCHHSRILPAKMRALISFTAADGRTCFREQCQAYVLDKRSSFRVRAAGDNGSGVEVESPAAQGWTATAKAAAVTGTYILVAGLALLLAPRSVFGLLFNTA